MYTLEYRPRKFSEMRGVSAGIQSLQDCANKDSFPQVMFLLGKTGTGKTTTAMIVASIINCENPQKDSEGNLEPCGECASCKNIHSSSFSRDTIFKDCSGMGKQDVLDLKETISVAPLQDKNIVVIMDEAQNLASKQAKGATLTLFESLPKGVYFILCSMEGWNIPDAMKQRGQVFNFKEYDEQTISLYLKEIMEKIEVWETIPDSFFEEDVERNLPPVIQLIASASGGSMRSAVQMLQRVLDTKLYTSFEVSEELQLFSDAGSAKLLRRIMDGEVSAINQLMNEDITSFFNKSYVGLLRAFSIYLNVEGTDARYAPKFIQELVYHPRLREMLELFTEVAMSGYIKHNVLIAKFLLQFAREATPKRKVTKRIPV